MSRDDEQCDERLQERTLGTTFKGEIGDDLIKKLQENGLDITYWNEKLLSKGITSLVQFKHADDTTKSELEKETNFGWEKNALAACFESKVDDKRDEKREKKLTKTVEKVQQRMKDMKSIIDDNERRTKIAISFNEALSHKTLHKDLTKWDLYSTEIATRDQISSSNLVSQISRGRILRGTFLHKNMKDLVAKRKLIKIQQIDEDFLLPSTTEKFTSIEFFDQKESQAFDHVIENWGLSAAVGLGKGLFSADFGYVTDNKEEITKRTTVLNAFTEIKDVVVVNTALFSIADVRHSLSDEAIEALKSIENSVASILKANCIRFFNAFGTHYFTGTYTFGGILKRSVQCCSNETVDQSETLKLVKKGKQGSISGMLASVTGDVEYSDESNKDENHGTLKQEENYTVKKELDMIGGPPEVDQISIWKLGLVKSNRTWAIVDKDDFRKNWTPVWDLLNPDTYPQLGNTDQLRENLIKAWIEFKPSS